MSAIGDYVHLYYKNYLLHGTAKPHEGKEFMLSSYAAQKNANKKRIANLKKQGVNVKTLTTLRKRVANEATQKEAMNLAKQMVKTNEANNSISELVKQTILENININKSGITNYTLSASDFTTDEREVDLEKAKIAKNTLYKSIERLNNDMAAGTNHKWKKSVEARLDTINKNFDDFFKKVGVVGTNGNISSLFKIDAQDGSLVALQKFLNNIQYSGIVAALHGKYGEVLANMVSDKAINLGEEGFKEFIEKAVQTGNISTSFSMTSNNILDSAQKIVKANTDLNLYEIHSSKDKVDALITIKDKNLNASVKAYTARGKYYTPHLQDVNLLTSLAATEKQFGNHWLNLHTKVKNKSGLGRRILAPTEELFNQHVAYEALVSGNMLKQDANLADTFISIDVKSGKVYAKSTASMLQNDFNKFNFSPKPVDLTFDNDRADTWQERIANLLMQAHKTQIYVTYKVYLSESAGE